MIKQNLSQLIIKYGSYKVRVPCNSDMLAHDPSNEFSLYIFYSTVHVQVMLNPAYVNTSSPGSYDFRCQFILYGTLYGPRKRQGNFCARTKVWKNDFIALVKIKFIVDKAWKGLYKTMQFPSTSNIHPSDFNVCLI